MSQKLYILAAGQTTPWINLQPWSGGGFELHGINAGGAEATLQVCSTDPTSPQDTPLDTISVETFSEAEFGRALYGPMPNFGRIKNTAGGGTVTMSFGGGVTSTGESAQVSEVSFAKGTSGRNNEMPS
jgi:hypothetical protein